MNKNTDVLLWEINDIANTIKNCLKHSVDITLFDQKHTFPGFLPDIVILTTKDIIKALQHRILIKQQYPHAKLLYVKQTINPTVMSIAMLVGFDGIFDLSIKSHELEQILCTIGQTSSTVLSQRKRSRLILDQYKDFNEEKLTFRQLAILCGIVRNLPHKDIAQLMNTTKGDVFIQECLICKTLGLTPKELHTPAMIKRYGAVEMEIPYKAYTIPSRLKRPGFYIIPRFE